MRSPHGHNNKHEIFHLSAVSHTSICVSEALNFKFSVRFDEFNNYNTLSPSLSN